MSTKILALIALSLATVTGAQASTLTPGGSVVASVLNFSGTSIGFYGGPLTYGDGTANYAVNVYADPTNVFCADCLDFVFQVDNISDTEPFTSFSVSDFPGTLDVGYSTASGFGSVAPTQITDSSIGVVTFDFTGLQANLVTDQLVIETSYTAFEVGSLTLTDGSGQSESGVSLQPIPEPSTLVLLGSGLVGLAGAARRRLLA